MSKSTKLMYEKHHVKRDPATLKFLTDKNGDPIPGEIIRKITLHEGTAEDLNAAWPNTGIVFIEVDRDEDAENAPTLKDEFPEVYKMKKDDLIQNCEAYGLETDGLVEELKERLALYLKEKGK